MGNGIYCKKTNKMFFISSEHNPPHFHAIYNGYDAEYDIRTLKLIDGKLPSKAEKLVLEWAAKHKKDLLIIWNTQTFKRVQPLE